MAEPPPIPPQFPARKKRSALPIILSVVGGIVFLAVAAAFGLGVVAFVKKVREKNAQRQEAVADLQKVTAEEGQRLGSTFQDGKSSLESVGRIRQQMEQSAAAVGGSEGLALRAMSDTLETIHVQQKAYVAATDKLREAAVLQGDVTDRAEIAKKRSVVNDFLLQNERLMEAFRSSTDGLKVALNKENVPVATQQGVIAGYENSQTKILPLMIHIRECDRNLGESLLAALTLYDTNWGKWRKDASGKLIFESGVAVKQYNEIVAKVHAIANDQVKAQSELAAVSKAMANGSPGGAAPPSGIRPGQP